MVLKCDGLNFAGPTILKSADLHQEFRSSTLDKPFYITWFGQGRAHMSDYAFPLGNKSQDSLNRPSKTVLGTVTSWLSS